MSIHTMKAGDLARLVKSMGLLPGLSLSAIRVYGRARLIQILEGKAP
jgi:hypothetical protein